MKVSIITISYNRVSTIGSSIESVLGQDYGDIEYIVVDGNSADGTREKIASYGSRISKFISEPDKGMYDALNKAIRMTTGDIIGLLHSDDVFYANDTISRYVEHFKKTGADLVYANGQYVAQTTDNRQRTTDNRQRTTDNRQQTTDENEVYIPTEPNNERTKNRKPSGETNLQSLQGEGRRNYVVKRIYRACPFRKCYLNLGWIPLHTTIFVRKDVFEQYGLYDESYSIASDYEISQRWFRQESIKKVFMNRWVVRMGLGGKSTSVGLQKKKSAEDMRVIRSYKMWGYFTLACKIAQKIPQYLSPRIFNYE